MLVWINSEQIQDIVRMSHWIDRYNSEKQQKQAEKMLKQQAVNKLAQILNQKPQSAGAARKLNSAELKKKEKENRKLQQDLTTEKEKFNQMVAKYQKDLQDLQVIMFYIAYL